MIFSLLFTDLISFNVFFHLSPAFDPWFAFLSGSVYSCLSSSLSVFHFFFLPGESPSHCRNISWAAEKTPFSSQLACQHLLCLCYDLWSDFWFYRASNGDLLTFSLGFSLEANLLKVLWCEYERSVRKWMVRQGPLCVCGFEWAEHVCGRWFGQWCQVFVYRISDTMKQMYSTSEQHLLCIERVYALYIIWSGSTIFCWPCWSHMSNDKCFALTYSWFPLNLPLTLLP